MASRLPLLLLAATALSCGDALAPPPPAASQALIFDLRPAFRGAGQEACATLLDSLIATVTPDGEPAQRFGRAVSAETPVVRIPVRVPAGPVTFAAEVRSPNATVLYRGSVTETVTDDAFDVEVPITAQTGIGKACPVPLLLAPSDVVYSGDLRLHNRGNAPLTWRATFPDDPGCDGLPCLAAEPAAGSLRAEDSLDLRVDARRDVPVSAALLRLVTPAGDLDVPLDIANRPPVARADTFVVREGTTAELPVLDNDTDPHGRPLGVVSVGPAAFGEAFLDDGSVFYGASAAVGWGRTSHDRFPYTVGSGGPLATAEAAVSVAPCFDFRAEASSEVAGEAFLAEHGVLVRAAPFFYTDTEAFFTFTTTSDLPAPHSGRGLVLLDAAAAFDLSGAPVHWVRFDVLDDADTVNVGINGGAVALAPAFSHAMALPAGVALTVFEGPLGADTRVVLESEAPIATLLLGGGGQPDDGELRTLTLANLCFGAAEPLEP